MTFCEYSETLLIKAVKQEERAGNLDGARELLSRLKHVGIENVSVYRPWFVVFWVYPGGPGGRGTKAGVLRRRLSVPGFFHVVKWR